MSQHLGVPLQMRWVGALPGHSSPRGGVRPEAVVLHIAEGSLAGMDAHFNNPAAGVAAHFGVGKDGTVHQYVSWHLAAHANGIVEPGYTVRLIDENPGINPNLWTIAVEHEGFTGETLTPRQWNASTRLVAWLFAAHLLGGGASGVAVDRDHILRHADITPRSRARCPGWDETYHAAYIAEVQRLLAKPTPCRERELLDALTVHRDAYIELEAALERLAALPRVRAVNLTNLIAQFRG
jgi:N-acetyl-anhydromuramyl-L-alanine amidase AmpD